MRAAAAVVVSLVQCVVGLMLIAAATRADFTRSGDLFSLVNRLDGLKMLAIAATAACLVTGTRPPHKVPRWLHITGAALAVALVASGCSYLLLWNTVVRFVK